MFKRHLDITEKEIQLKFVLHLDRNQATDLKNQLLGDVDHHSHV